MVSINLYQTQFTDDEWDAIERALIIVSEIVHKPRMAPFRGAIAGDDWAEMLRLDPHVETALLKIELAQS